MRPHQDIFVDYVSAYIGMDKPLHKGQARPQLIGDALHIPLSDGSVDAVLATELMEHLSAPGSFISEVSRVLRGGGSLVLSVPFMEPLHEEPRDYYRFTPYSLHDLLGKHGLEVEWIKPKGGWWSVTLGSFTNQALYDWANPANAEGQRPNRPLALLLAIPLCAAAQLAAYLLDRIFKSSKYTLGFVVLATRKASGTGGTTLEKRAKGLREAVEPVSGQVRR
jgi:SAM-dependent methyltransferase